MTSIINKYYLIIIKILAILIIVGISSFTLIYKLKINQLNREYKELSDRTKKTFEEDKELITLSYRKEKDAASNMLNQKTQELDKVKDLNKTLSVRIRNYENNPKYDNLDFLNAVDHLSKYKYRPSK